MHTSSGVAPGSRRDSTGSGSCPTRHLHPRNRHAQAFPGSPPSSFTSPSSPSSLFSPSCSHPLFIPRQKVGFRVLFLLLQFQSVNPPH